MVRGLAFIIKKQREGCEQEDGGMRGFGGVAEENKLVETPTRVLKPEQSRNRSRAILRPTGEWRLNDRRRRMRRMPTESVAGCLLKGDILTSSAFGGSLVAGRFPLVGLSWPVGSLRLRVDLGASALLSPIVRGVCCLGGS